MATLQRLELCAKTCAIENIENIRDE